MKSNSTNTHPDRNPHRHMTRSQGPVDPLDTTHLNPSDCYVRSYTWNGQYNVNASYNTVSLPIKEKRRKLVTEISLLLGTYAGDWFPLGLRPRYLPLHPLDWSTIFLQRLCNAGQHLAHLHSIERRLFIVHNAMKRLYARPNADVPTPHLTAFNNSADPGTSSHVNEPTEDSSKEEEFEGLREENQRLIDRVEAMSDEVAAWLKELTAQTFDMRVDHKQLEATAMTLLNCRQEMLDLRDRSERLSQDVAQEELRSINDRMQTLVLQQAEALGFS